RLHRLARLRGARRGHRRLSPARHRHDPRGLLRGDRRRATAHAGKGVVVMDTVEMLRVLVGFDTTSRNSNLGLIGWVADFLQGQGARLRFTRNDDGTKANLLASLGPDRADGIVLSGHTDVVPVDGQAWQSDPFVLTEREGRLHGRGT